jgi:hypothetical protein
LRGRRGKALRRIVYYSLFYNYCQPKRAEKCKIETTPFHAPQAQIMRRTPQFMLRQRQFMQAQPAIHARSAIHPAKPGTSLACRERGIYRTRLARISHTAKAVYIARRAAPYIAAARLRSGASHRFFGFCKFFVNF